MVTSRSEVFFFRTDRLDTSLLRDGLSGDFCGVHPLFTSLMLLHSGCSLIPLFLCSRRYFALCTNCRGQVQMKAQSEADVGGWLLGGWRSPSSRPGPVTGA